MNEEKHVNQNIITIKCLHKIATNNPFLVQKKKGLQKDVIKPNVITLLFQGKQEKKNLKQKTFSLSTNIVNLRIIDLNRKHQQSNKKKDSYSTSNKPSYPHHHLSLQSL